MDITDQVLPVLAFLPALLKSSSVVLFLKAGFLFALAAAINRFEAARFAHR